MGRPHAHKQESGGEQERGGEKIEARLVINVWQEREVKGAWDLGKRSQSFSQSSESAQAIEIKQNSSEATPNPTKIKMFCSVKVTVNTARRILM